MPGSCTSIKNCRYLFRDSLMYLQLTGDGGVNNVNIPGFFYAEDGVRLYNAIHNYVEQYVHHYYSGVNEKGKLLFTGKIKMLTFITSMKKMKSVDDVYVKSSVININKREFGGTFWILSF